MAKEVLELTVKSNIGEVTKETDDLGKSIGKASDETKDLDKRLEETGKSGSKGFRAIGTAVKGFGMALKAAGIGLVIALFVSLKESLERNQKVMDTVNTIMGTISTTFNQVANVLVEVFNWTTKSTDRFDGLGKTLSGLVTLALTPLKVAFFGLKLGVQEVQLAWEKWVGGADPKKIAELKKGIDETTDSLAEIAKEAVSAGADIYNNIGDAIGEIGAIGKKAIEGISEISIKSNYELAKATTAAANSSKLAEAAIQGLIEKYDRQAELQRQIRDDETKTFAERIAANQKLGEILDEQETKMLALADTRVASAALELSANKENVELQVAYQQALNDRAGVEAQVAGFRSEQMTNEVSLNKELAEIKKEVTNATLEGIALELEELKNSYEMQLEMARKAGEDTTALNEKYAKDKKAISEKYGKEEIENEKAVLEAKKAIRDANISNIEAGIGLVKDLAGENKSILAAAVVAENAVGIAKMIMANNTANVAALATPQAILTSGASAIPVIAANNISTAIGVASSIAATAKALSQLGGGGSAGSAPSLSGGSGGPTAAATTPAPQMMSGAFELGGGVKPEPMKAFVVTDEMSNSQSQLANIRRRATI
jgi:hypothetical protein